MKMKKLFALLALAVALSSSSFACPFHHISSGAVATYKFVRPVTNPVAHFLYKVGKYIVT
jgi:hypothetical protein